MSNIEIWICVFIVVFVAGVMIYQYFARYVREERSRAKDFVIFVPIFRTSLEDQQKAHDQINSKKFVWNCICKKVKELIGINS